VRSATRCITGALQHHLRDRVRLVRIPHRLHEQGQCPLGHLSLDASSDGEPCLLNQLVEQLPAAQATALRLTLLEGLSLRAAAERLQISAMSVSHREVRHVGAAGPEEGDRGPAAAASRWGLRPLASTILRKTRVARLSSQPCRG
jgi:hypothetical protein